MANRLKGETEIQVEGETFRLVFDWQAWAAIEDRFGMPWRHFVREYWDEMPAGRMPDVLRIALMHYRPDLTLEQAGAFVSEIGFEETLLALSDAMLAAFPRTTAQAAEGAADPQTPPAAPAAKSSKTGSSGKA